MVILLNITGTRVPESHTKRAPPTPPPIHTHTLVKNKPFICSAYIIRWIEQLEHGQHGKESPQVQVTCYICAWPSWVFRILLLPETLEPKSCWILHIKLSIKVMSGKVSNVQKKMIGKSGFISKSILTWV